MLQRRIIPSDRQCLHVTCGKICHRQAPQPQQKHQPIKRYNYKPKENSAALDVFFKEMMAKNEPVCDCCGSFMPHLKAPFYEKHWKSCQAHLLEKRHFHSIATNPLNIMVLGSGY